MDSGKIGAYIQLKRKSAGLTQTQLGDMLGITSKAVSKWETGVAIPDVSLFPELTKILNITIEELLQGEDNKVIPPEKKKRNIIIILSIILSLITIFLITTIIYFKSNYKKVEVYKLESAKDNFHVEGSLISIDGNDYLVINKVDYLGNAIKLFDKVRDFEYKIYYMDIIIFNSTKIKKEISLKECFDLLFKTTIPFEYNPFYKKGFDVYISYVSLNGIKKNISFKFLVD